MSAHNALLLFFALLDHRPLALRFCMSFGFLLLTLSLILGPSFGFFGLSYCLILLLLPSLLGSALCFFLTALFQLLAFRAPV